MFEVLAEKLNNVFRLLGSRGKLTEKEIDEALRQVRLALLEADVNFKVVKDFTGRVKERSIGKEVMESLSPGQQIIKIVNEELIKTLGDGASSKLVAVSQPPAVILMAGLQGSGKTTTAAKLALLLKHGGHKPMLVAADNHRPAAISRDSSHQTAPRPQGKLEGGRRTAAGAPPGTASGDCFPVSVPASIRSCAKRCSRGVRYRRPSLFHHSRTP